MPHSPDPRPAPGIAALIVAAGSGSRAASSAGGPAKQYAMIGSSTVLGHTLNSFTGHSRVGSVLTVIAAGDEAAYAATATSVGADGAAKLRPPVHGGATRQQSVANGLEALAAIGGPDLVLIHDAARPFASGATVDAVIDALSRAQGALPVLPLADTVKRLDGAQVDGARIVATEDRSRLGAAQTPQGFAFAAILEAHRRARAAGRSDFTDDAAVGEWAGLNIVAVAGDPANGKITTAQDLQAAGERVSGARAPLETRMATGFDVHAFGPGNSVRLCGIDVVHDKGLLGHSDADVALHALTDALYGTIGAADIGFHFPPSEARWKGADSAVFLHHARGEVERRGGRIIHVDVTIICERPKVGPHRAAMVARLAALLGLDEGRVSVKATTTEKLGFAGRGEGIAAQAAATVALPPAPSTGASP